MLATAPQPREATRVCPSVRVTPRGARANAFLSRVARLKLKEFPEFVFTTARDYDYRGRAATFAKEYNEKYISKGSIQPLFHFMGGVFGVAYVTVWPTEYRHMMAERRGGHH